MLKLYRFGDNLSKGTVMAIREIITVNPTSKCLSRFFFASLTVLVACLMIFSAVVQGGYDVETVLRKPLPIVQLTVDWYRREKRVIRQNEVLHGYL